MVITDWTVETNGTLGKGGEYTPVAYPRSDAERQGEGDVNPGAQTSESGEGDLTADKPMSEDMSDHSNDTAS